MTATVPNDAVSSFSQSKYMLTKCCCCIPLRIGCFILGYLNLVFNLLHTFYLISAIIFIGMSTHWYLHFDYDRSQVFTDQSTGIESIERPLLSHIAIIFMVLLTVNVIWLAVNVAVLVGLHKKRPGPIKMYVTFALARLFLIISGLLYLSPGYTGLQDLVTYIIYFGSSAYFIWIYYIHALQLEREITKCPETPVTNTKDVAFIYPTKIDQF